MNFMYDTIIIGGGPTGAAAGVYAARKKMNTLLVTADFGGQSIISPDIQNWIGETNISGVELAKKLEAHLRAQKGIEIKDGERAVKVEKKEDGGFQVVTDKGSYAARTVIVGSGARHRKLNVPGEQEFDGRGVAYCATCDTPLFKGKSVAVVGSGNSGLEAVRDLAPYASAIYLVNRGASITGDPLTFEKIEKFDNFKGVIHNAEIMAIVGDRFVTELKYKDLKSNEEKALAVQGIFVEIGAVPNSEIVAGLVEMNRYGEIILDHRTGATTCPGIFAAGDVTDELYKQNNISAGDAVKAALSAYEYVKKQS